MVKPELLAEVLGRKESLFNLAVAARLPELQERIRASRTLVIGAGGSIGAAFVRVLARYQPAALCLVDLSENNLVRLIRDLHGEGKFPAGEFSSCAVGFDETEFTALLTALPPFDYILNFAALKHVRSERDPFTAMRLLRINVLANHSLLTYLSARPPRNYFSVSSDKAVNPGSLMGASKAFMERICLTHSKNIPFTSARFANVAFSDGSLLQSFCERIQRGQPLAGPSDVRRYFISHEEAGELCLLAAFLGANREIFTPQLQAGVDLKSFAEIAGLVLRSHGYEPHFCASENEALRWRRNAKDRQWPCYFAPSNTSGEKPYEEFHGTGEAVDSNRFTNINVVTTPANPAAAQVVGAVYELEELRRSGKWSKPDLLRIVRSVVPEFQHIAGESDLDQKL